MSHLLPAAGGVIVSLRVFLLSLNNCVKLVLLRAQLQLQLSYLEFERTLLFTFLGQHSLEAHLLTTLFFSETSCLLLPFLFQLLLSLLPNLPGHIPEDFLSGEGVLLHALLLQVLQLLLVVEVKVGLSLLAQLPYLLLLLVGVLLCLSLVLLLELTELELPFLLNQLLYLFALLRDVGFHALLPHCPLALCLLPLPHLFHLHLELQLLYRLLQAGLHRSRLVLFLQHCRLHQT